MIGKRRVEEAVGEDPRPRGKGGFNHLAHELGAGRRKHQRLGFRRDLDLGEEHKLAKALAHERSPWLARHHNRPAFGTQRIGKDGDLGALSGAVDPLERDETPPAHSGTHPDCDPDNHHDGDHQDDSDGCDPRWRCQRVPLAVGLVVQPIEDTRARPGLRSFVGHVFTASVHSSPAAQRGLLSQPRR